MPRTIMRTSFKVKRTKIKVTRRITVETESVSYLSNAKAYELNKNLAIANRSRVSCINTNNNTMTLKSGLEVTQGH